MFRLTDNIDSMLLSREVSGHMEENVLRLYIQKNIFQNEFSFFQHDMVCAWNYKAGIGQSGMEVLYVLSEKRKNAVERLINDIFDTNARLFEMPDYSEYIQHMQKVRNSQNVIKKMIDLLIGQENRTLTKQEYQKELERLQACRQIPFRRGIFCGNGQEPVKAAESRSPLRTHAEEHKLAFMGCFCYCDASGRLERLLGLKLLEKMYGTNEVDSVYFPLRCEGKIYTAISSYVMESGLFVTGVLADYQRELHQRTLELSRNVLIQEELLASAKRRLMDDIKFVAFQYGELFSLLPYIYALKYEVDMQEIRKVLAQITVEDVAKLANRDMHAIAMGVNS